jgi:hypothetical protein
MLIPMVTIPSCMPMLNEKVSSRSSANLCQINILMLLTFIKSFLSGICYTLFLSSVKYGITHCTHCKARQCVFTEDATFLVCVESKLVLTALTFLSSAMFSRRNLQAFKRFSSFR